MTYCTRLRKVCTVKYELAFLKCSTIFFWLGDARFEETKHRIDGLSVGVAGVHAGDVGVNEQRDDLLDVGSQAAGHWQLNLFLIWL